jgi:hypothetical protein
MSPQPYVIKYLSALAELLRMLIAPHARFPTNSGDCGEEPGTMSHATTVFFVQWQYLYRTSFGCNCAWPLCRHGRHETQYRMIWKYPANMSTTTDYIGIPYWYKIKEMPSCHLNGQSPSSCPRMVVSRGNDQTKQIKPNQTMPNSSPTERKRLQARVSRDALLLFLSSHILNGTYSSEGRWCRG